ncbi:MAG: S8 family serine peptidase [Saprospiraceae bacterium]|nr:S8 family serine peptidase [Saprospiraceae bacterium]
MQKAIEATPDGFHSIHVLLADQVDLTSLDAQLTAQRAPASQRATAVIMALQEKAGQTQGELLHFLEELPAVQKGTVQPLWIANAVFMEAKAPAIAALSQRSDVAWVGLNRPAVLQSPESACTAPPASPNGREPGLSAIKAPALWAKGYTGYGRKAYIADTGVDPTHPALEAHYRGLYVPQEQAWLDLDPHTFLPTNTEPFDCQTHGTHVAGTVMGLDRLNNDTIGVAFNAQWIASPILYACGKNTQGLALSLQWALDPDGNPATSDDIPDVINNSWGIPADSMMVSDCGSIYVGVEAALEAAGIATVWSAGNDGPGTGTIGRPQNINTHEVSLFSIGALDGNNPQFPIAGFSSRGPSQCGGTGSLLIKPEVSAPGFNVRSSVPGGGYDFYNGTSMAAPHVSGAILLLKEAFPDATAKELKLALYHTCTDLGTPGEDNTYGMGIINVEAAFDYMVAQGFVPTSPLVANDVMLLDASLPFFSCETEVVAKITVENAGTDTLFSFDVSYQAGASANTWGWSGSLAPQQRAVIVLPPLATAPGAYKLQLELQNPNGVPDARPLNNRLVKNVRVSDRANISAELEGPSGAVCENTPAVLRAASEGPETPAIAWYDAPVGGNKLAEGTVFVTPPVTQPTTWFAEAKYQAQAGPLDLTIGETGLDDVQELGLSLDVHAPFTLKSVKIFVEATGGRAIVLRNEQGETVYQKIVTISTTGEVVVQLNWQISPGRYSLIKNLGKPLFHNKTGAVYPSSVEDIFDITGTTDGLGAAGAWYYFYDWQIAFTEPCGRTAVSVGVMPAGSVPQVAFALAPDSVDLSQQLPVQFTNATTNAAGPWHWDFGDGNESSEENPSHLYQEAGDYIVSLLAAGPTGCMGFALDTVQVTDSFISDAGTAPSRLKGVTVFPNPVSGTLFLRLELGAPQNLELELFDLTGRKLRSASFAAVQSDLLPLDVAGLPDGLYFLLVKTLGGNGVWKVVKGG